MLKEIENSNSKTLILNDSSVKSIWAYLTASLCSSTNRERESVFVCACVCCMRVCVRVCVRARVRACVCVCWEG